MRPGDKTPFQRRMLWVGLFVLAALSAWRLSQEPPGPVRTQFDGRTMGTTWSVKLGSHAPAQDADEVRAVIQATLDRVERNLSTYREDSDVSRVSRAKMGETVPVSHDTVFVLQRAREISERTNGAFDVTVAPLVRAWGFGAGAKTPQAPSDAEREALLERVGFDKLEVDPAAQTVRKTARGVEVDLSAIAKGYGVDEVARRLSELGLHDHLVEVGGELRVSGGRAPGEPWRLAIEEPDAAGRGVHRELTLPDGGALATSGDYRNFYETAGGRVSHTIDPRTGWAITTRVASASVVADDCMTADALATAVGVLGAEASLEMADLRGWAIYVLKREGDALVAEHSAAFEPHLTKQTP